MATITEVFAKKKLWAWFNAPVTNSYDGVSEKGQDYSTAFGTPVAAPVGGTVQRLQHNDNAINDVVEILCDDSSVWLYQHITASVKVGDTLQCGSVVGTENGLPIDQYSTGPHIEVRYAKPGTWSAAVSNWSEPWVNPSSVFSAIGAQQAGSVAQGGLASVLSAVGIGGGGPIQLSPNADVNLLLWTLDQVLALQNPFNVPNATTDNINVPGGSVSFTDPISWLGGFGLNLVEDLAALVVRVAFIVLGVLILYKVASSFIDFGSLASGIGGLGELAAGLA